MTKLGRSSMGFLLVAAFVSCGGARAADAVFDGLDPLEWARPPHARLSHAITMAAETVAAPGGVEYNFLCTAGGAKDSGWQLSPEHQATGLKPETPYTFVAKVRDKTSKEELRSPSRPIAATTRKAARFDEIVAKEIELLPVMLNGGKDNRINIVVANRWRKGERNAYNKPELRETFLKDVRDVIEPGFAPGGPKSAAPFAAYRNFFNAYALWWPSIPPWDPPAYDKGEPAAHWEVYNELRARLFLPWLTEGRGWVTHLAMVNSRGGGGGAGLRLDERVGDAMIEGNEINPFFHEFSHTAMRLGDVYVAWGMWGRADESSNTTLIFQREKVKWKAWIDPATPVPTPYTRKCLRTIGLFEGGTHRACYIFRATPVCTMGVNQFAESLCPLCIQWAAQRMYDYVNPIEDPRPAREQLTLKSPGRARFSIRRVKPVPDTQSVEWRLNGKLIAEATDAVEVELGAVAEYEISCTVTDRSSLIRPDPPFAEYPRAQRRWKITNPKPTSQAAPLAIALGPQNPSCRGANDGAIAASVSGGAPPYTYLWANGAAEKDLKGLDAGAYSLRVVDGEFRHAEAACALARPCTLAPDLRSTLANGRWQLALQVSGDNPANLAVRWSTGATGHILRDLPDGRYRYTVTHKSGAEITGEVELAKPQRPLELTVLEATPSTGENNGQIRLGITGGREPYAVAWSDDPKLRSPERLFLRPGSYTVVVRDANLTPVERAIPIRDEPPFTLERPVFEKSPAGGVRIANPQKGCRYLWYAEDYPSYILHPPRGVYEGTFTTKEGRVVEADGAVVPNTNGKWANPESLDKEHNRKKNDYGSWVRLDAFVAGRRALPLTLRLQTNHKGQPWAKLDVFGETKRSQHTGEIVPEGKWKGTVDRGKLTVEGDGPEGGRFDLYYTARHEAVSRPIHTGSEFRPPKPGNYYVAAQKEDTGALSANRVGLAVTMGPAPAVLAKPTRPDEVKSARLLLWLDATDMDGDGVGDSPPWERGSLLGWRGKPGGMTPTSFVICEPNAQNGRPVASWQYIWLENLEREVKGFQTILMVYRDHELSKEGTGPWRGVPAWVWDLRQAGEATRKAIPGPLRSARVWLNGAPTDLCATPAPLAFSVATFEYASPLGGLRQTTPEWEGAVAEFVAYDGKLSDDERRGVEEYLRRRWISAMHLGG